MTPTSTSKGSPSTPLEATSTWDMCRSRSFCFLPIHSYIYIKGHLIDDGDASSTAISPASSHTMSTPMPPFLSHSAQSMQRIQAVLARRESQRRTVCFSDPEKLATVSLDVLPQAVRDAFSAHVATSSENASKNRCEAARVLWTATPQAELRCMSPLRYRHRPLRSNASDSTRSMGFARILHQRVLDSRAYPSCGDAP